MTAPQCLLEPGRLVVPQAAAEACSLLEELPCSHVLLPTIPRRKSSVQQELGWVSAGSCWEPSGHLQWGL